jgi:hypothetical protein
MEYRGSKLSISQDPLRSIRVYPVAQAAIPIMKPRSCRRRNLNFSKCPRYIKGPTIASYEMVVSVALDMSQLGIGCYNMRGNLANILFVGLSLVPSLAVADVQCSRIQDLQHAAQTAAPSGW